ncbi:hypothetical protein M0R45_018948 [Rubus argutus]|uniref:Uncharacterized protein n=1 Tax=Rubus argutus TaxID=59490 RepID=A0AAW1X7P8_RUBAR
MPRYQEEVEEPKTFPPPGPIQRKTIKCFPRFKALRTYFLNERIEIKVLLPLNPPFGEVKDWKGSVALVHNPPPHYHILLPPTPSPSIKSTCNLKEKSIRILRRTIAKKMIRRLEGNHSFGHTLKHLWIALGLASMTLQEVL